MKGKSQCVVSTVLMGVAMLVLLHMNVSGIIWYNDSDIGFGGQAGVAALQEKPMRAYVIEGAGYFLGSYSDFLLLLNKVEMSELQGCNFNELLVLVNRAIEKMQYANESYLQLKQKADVTSYNPVIIDELQNFDYDAFAHREGFIEPIFKEVKAFLSKGHIREMYGEALSHTQGILNIAMVIKTNLEEGVLPETSDLHDLNEAYAHYMLFGEYAAEVFQQIK
jgi:hypothetical protein